jgi:serine phosphatase RsbU (regulator of sigma subunit)
VMIVVGDVSGRGLGAGTMMASLRYAIRAFASRSDTPAAILTGLTRLIDLEQDGHFATVLCATLDWRNGLLTIANAGHPNPLLVSGQRATFLDTTVGPPIGVTRDACYPTVEHMMPNGSTLLTFTDGLVERRGENIDVSMERLRRSVPLDGGRLDEIIDRLLSNQADPDAHDDSAILGVQWTSPTT